VFHYSAAADRPANRRFVDAWKKEYGASSTPNFVAVAAWDGMDAIFHVVKAQKGRIDPERTMSLFKSYAKPDSPLGPISIDPETRDIVLRAVKDPWKEMNKK
jgi:branched-chain amino acid transport system substrate-binding protein